MAHYELRCRECGKGWGNEPRSICDTCFSPLEVSYDYSAVKISRDEVARRPANMWRYAELLPLPDGFHPSLPVGFTPLVGAPQLARELGAKRLCIKNDAVCFPTLSFKDRVVAVAVAQARAFGLHTIACSSTGNLANAVAAQAAREGLKAVVFIPADLEPAKILGTQVFGAKVIRIAGTYDHVNRLCSQIADERLKLGLVEARPVKFFGAQASGCSPISTAVKQATAEIEPQKPSTIARSLAIGSPADGHYALKTIRGSGGWAEDVSDAE